MPVIPVHIPAVLADVTGCARTIEARGSTVREVLEDVVSKVPTLRIHLYEESGNFRTHVLCFLNETNTRWLSSLETPVTESDELTILQAVSGGVCGGTAGSDCLGVDLSYRTSSQRTTPSTPSRMLVNAK